MAWIDVRNKKGTEDKRPPAGCVSWLDFWEKKKSKRADKCEVAYCPGSAELGGHVIKAGQGGREYILPMCTSCNNKPDGESFRAWEDDLVPVQ